MPRSRTACRRRTEINPDELIALLGALNDAAGPEAAAQLVHACPAATAPEAVDILREAAREAGAGGDQDSAQFLERYALILDHCRVIGPDETFAEVASRKPGPADRAWDDAEQAWQAYQHDPGTRRLRQAERRWRRLLSVLPPPVPGHWPEAGLHASLKLAEILTMKHQEHADRGAVDEAVGLLRQAAEREPPPDLRAEILGGLGAALAIRYEGWGAPADLDDAIAALSGADIAEAPRQVHANALSMLCGALLGRYEEHGTPADLAASVDAGQRAIDRAEAGTAEWYGASNNLGLALLTRYEQDGGLADLSRSADLLERAAGQVPGPGAPGNAEALGNLGIARLSWYEATGEDAALAAAITAITAALAAAGPDAPGRPANLNTLGACLAARHDRTGDLDDLHAAEAAFAEAARTTLPGARERAIYLDNLSGALRSRYTRHGDSSALSRAVDVAREAVVMTGADAPERSRRTLSLAHALGVRYEAHGAEADLETSLDSYREAVARSPVTAPDHWLYLAGLGAGLLDRLGRARDPADVDEAVAVHRDAVRTAAAGTPELPGLHLHYAHALRIRQEAGNVEHDPAGVREEYERAGELGLRQRPEVALAAYRELGEWAVERADWPQAGQAYWNGIAAMHLLVGSQVTRTDREVWLRTARGVPARAAATLAAAGLAEKAAVAYERGRAILLTEALDRQQADLEAVRAAGRPDLADQYLAAAGRVTALGQDELSEATARPAGLLDQRAASRRRARDELDQASAAIREDVMPGFRRPVELGEVVEAAGNVPVVQIVAGPVQGIALIIHDGVLPVPLPLLTEAGLAARARDFVTAREERRQNPQAWDLCLDDTTRWLWDAVFGPIIEMLEPSGRAVLVPAGELGALPLHAAWTTDPATGGRAYVLDRLLVTYAPNARALAASQRTAAARDAGPLLVIDDAGAGLRAVSTEATLVRQGFAGGAARAGAPAPAPGETSEVIAALSHHGTAHFACHGVANLTEPLDSALLLPGGRLALRDLLTHGPFPLRLAVLSACETAVSGADLPDEVIGLPAGFLEAGAAGAIGSLWAVPDASTMLVMARFYEMWRDPAAAMPAAEALRQAQIWVRDASNGAKHARFPECTPPRLRDMPAARRSFWEAANSHAHPRSWAAFAFYGA